MNNQALKDARSAMNTRLFLLFLGMMMVMNSIMSSGRYGMSWLNLAKEVEQGQKDGTINIEEPLETPVTEAAPQENAAAESLTERDAAEAVTEGSTELTSGAGTEELDLNEFARQMKQVGITTNDLRMLGILSLIVAVIELLVGMICIVFANRVDRAKIVFTAVCVLLAAEAVFIIFSALKGSLMLSNILYSVIIPGILFWFALKLRKFAREDPERVYVVPPQGAAAGRGRNASRKGAAATGSKPDGGKTGRTEVTPIPGRKSLHDRAMMRASETPAEAAKESAAENVPETDSSDTGADVSIDTNVDGNADANIDENADISSVDENDQ